MTVTFFLLTVGLAAQVPAAPSLQDVLTLSTALKLAGENHPRVRETRHRWEAARSAQAQSWSLPDPRLTFSGFARSIETRTGPQRWSLTLSQSIPFPEKLILAGRIADRRSKMAYLEYEAALRDALAEAKERFFEIYYLDRALETTRLIQGLYRRYASQAGTGEGRDGVKISEVMRSEGQMAQIGYDLLLLQEMRLSEAEALRAALGMRPGTPIGSTVEIVEPPAFDWPLERLHDIASRGNQELARGDMGLEKARLEARLARRAFVPDFQVSAQYVSVGRPLSPTPDGGRDPLAVGVGISLPIWFWKNRSKAREAQRLQEAAQASLDGIRSRLRAEVTKAYFRMTNASRLVELYRDVLIPQSRRAWNVSEDMYRNNLVDLTSLTETAAAVHNFELARLRAVADFYQQASRLERLLGRALDLSPSEDRP